MMARYTGPVCRLCRREKMKLFLKGPKCDSMKCPIERRPYPPGDHGRGRMRESEYLFQLREKQKARRIYGVLEKQFRNLYEEANRQERHHRREPPAHARAAARQRGVPLPGGRRAATRPASSCATATSTVNGKRVTIPSYQVRKGDVVSIREKSRSMIVIRHNLDTLDRQTPPWLERRGEGWETEVLNPPLREHIDVPVREQLIVELYSK